MLNVNGDVYKMSTLKEINTRLNEMEKLPIQYWACIKKLQDSAASFSTNSPHPPSFLFLKQSV